MSTLWSTGCLQGRTLASFLPSTTAALDVILQNFIAKCLANIIRKELQLCKAFLREWHRNDQRFVPLPRTRYMKLEVWNYSCLCVGSGICFKLCIYYYSLCCIITLFLGWICDMCTEIACTCIYIFSLCYVLKASIVKLEAFQQNVMFITLF